MASIGEVLLLNRQPDEWTIGYGAEVSFGFGELLGDARVSTDVISTPHAGGPIPDAISGDVEEANLLFAGASNLISTRSDVFTVYFKVRRFRRNPATGVWDATDPKQIVDDSRYVMMVDRSEVNQPSDRAKILYLEKLP